MERLVSVYRGGHLESFHIGSVAVVDCHGRLIAAAGDPAAETFLRSAAKPFQAIPLLQEGALEEFELTGEELALICASHGGEPHHLSTVAAILRKGDFDETDLLCGIHAPFDERVAAELRQAGEQPSPLHNNCSGKHAGMLLATQLLDVPSTNYTQRTHPLQQQILQTLADFADLDPGSIFVAVDGCGVPSFSMSLYRGAFAYARLGATAAGLAEPAGLPRYADSAREIVEAMTAFPEYLAGAWSITTPLIQAFGRELLAKEGAEGVYAITLMPSLVARLPERLSLGEDSTLGIAIKIADGSSERGRNPVILHTLEQLGLDIPDSEALRPYKNLRVKNAAGHAVGEVKAEFDLKFL
jgi:L-asparaginase II